MAKTNNDTGSIDFSRLILVLLVIWNVCPCSELHNIRFPCCSLNAKPVPEKFHLTVTNIMSRQHHLEREEEAFWRKKTAKTCTTQLTMQTITAHYYERYSTDTRGTAYSTNTFPPASSMMQRKCTILSGAQYIRRIYAINRKYIVFITYNIDCLIDLHFS